MKSSLLITFISSFFSFASLAQVTQINSNRSLEPTFPLTNDKTILISGTDNTVWVTNGTLAGTIQLSTTIFYMGAEAVVNGKFVFKGSSVATGTEIFVTDGTIGGTMLLNDIYPGATGSVPDIDMAVLNGFVYFTASRPAEGRELWRTDGTPGGTTFVKDIVAGPTNSNDPDGYHLFSNGTYLLMSVKTVATGAELWKSDGSGGGTAPLFDINTGAASSNPDYFFPFNNLVFFQATDATHGKEYWKTDGTPGGTTILKDINPGVPSAFSLFNIPFFYQFNGKAFFIADDGTHGDEIWSTDGSEVNTDLLKDIQTGPFASTFVITSIKVGNKFFFTSTNNTDRFEIWESNGTPAGTQLFMAFTPADATGSPFIFPNYTVDINTGNFSQPLFQGNKFFFRAGTVAEGSELWISDGTLAGTHMVKNIGPGSADGVALGLYTYTASHLYFGADDGVHGVELWKSDGTDIGTTMVADINPNAEDADPSPSFFVNNGKLLFTATNGDDPNERDLYVLDGVLPLPVHLLDFTVTPKSSDAFLQWSTAQEINSKDFVVERSVDGVKFMDLGTVSAVGNTSVKSSYSFIDAGMLNSGKEVVYYRLNARDKDGRSSASKVISLNIKASSQWSARLMNNPVAGNVRIMVNGITDKVQFTVQDLTGKTLYRSVPAKTNGQVSIPVDHLQPGVYILISESNNERKSVKFVKQ